MRIPSDEVSMAILGLCNALHKLNERDPSAAIREAGDAIASIRSTQIELLEKHNRQCREMFDKLWRDQPDPRLAPRPRQ